MGQINMYGPEILIPDRPKKIHIIDNEDKVGRAVEKLLRYDVLGYDVETYHAFDKNIPAFDPCNGARMRLAQWATPDGYAYVFDLRKVSRDFLYHMFPNKFLCVIQNAKFELKYLMWELGIFEYGDIWDTMIAEQIISEGRVTGKGQVPVGLNMLAKRILDVTLPKDEQASHWYKDDLSKSQIEYAARDAQIVLPIWQWQREKLKAQSQVRTAELEFRTIRPIAWMENNGFTMDPVEWAKVCDQTTIEIEAVKSELYSLIGRQRTLFDGIPTINLNSQDQVGEAFEDAGMTLPIHPETGEVTLSNKLLVGLSNHRSIELYIKYVKLAKRIQSYGYDWADKINPYTGRIHCQLKQIGADTGRMACLKPNLMQIPKDSAYRSCFRARNGWVLVDRDLSQAELRILAEFCRDPNMLSAFDNDYDLHRFTASLIFKVPMEEVTDYQRSLAKNLNFGIVYGIGSAKFANDSGIDPVEAQKIMDYYLKKAYPGMGQWLETQGRDILYGLNTRTMVGRVRQYNGDLSDKQFKSQVQRNAKNMPVQGTCADITKLALCLSYDKIVAGGYTDVIKLTLPIHDEIVSDSHPAYASISDHLIDEAMMEAEGQFLRRVPCKVDGDITVRWIKSPTEDDILEAKLLMEGV